MARQLIAAMLGARRVGIADAARRFQSESLIGHRRGRISVLNTAGLKKHSCEYYRFIRRHYASLRGELPRLLSVKTAGRAIRL